MAAAGQIPPRSPFVKGGILKGPVWVFAMQLGCQLNNAVPYSVPNGNLGRAYGVFREE
jgi:hypothetical protein